MIELKKGYRGAMALLLALAVVFAGGVPAGARAYAATAETPAAVPSTKTIVRGVKKTITPKSYKKAPKDLISVTPAYGRTVKLYLYNSQTEKWVKKKTYVTTNEEKAYISIAYPKQWKAHYTSKWKIVVPAVAADAKKGTPAASKVTIKTTLHNKVPSCKTAIVMDASTGNILYDYKMNTKRHPASMTKMMTSVLLTEKKKMSTNIPITQAARNETKPWHYGFKVGDSMTAANALYAMLLPSANDAAAACGIAISGNTTRFGKLMTKRAKALGMENTVYLNAHGLDVGKTNSTGNYTTAYDQALLASYIMTSPKTSKIRTVMKAHTKKIRTTQDKVYTLYNTNELLGLYGCIGMKTGTEDLAGYCFCGAFNYKGKVYITVVMGADTLAARWSSTKALEKYMEYAVDKKIKLY